MRKRALFGMVAALIGALLLPAALAQQGDEDESPKLKADIVNRERTRVKMKNAATSPPFQAAVKQVAAALGVQPVPLETEADGADTGGVEFAPVPHAKADAILSGPLRKQLLAQGVFLFRSDDDGWLTLASALRGRLFRIAGLLGLGFAADGECEQQELGESDGES